MKIYLSLILILTFIFSAIGQTPVSSPTPQDDQPIKVSTFLLNIPVIASDRDGRYISGLTKDNFTILEDGEKQPIEFFADAEAPMNVAILIDTSLSTRPFLGNIKAAARDFLTVFRPKDQGLIASFDSETKILSDFTSDTKQLKHAIDKAHIAAHSGSRMEDAIYELVTNKFSSIKGRKAIIVLTDGVVGGTISDEKVLSTLAELDVLVYPILFRREETDLPALYLQKIRLEDGEVVTFAEFEKRRRQLFIERMNLYATDTGGRLYNNSNNFKKIFQDIANELKYQYLVGFYPLNLDDDKSHKVIVAVNRKEIVIRSKRRIQVKSTSKENKF